MSHTVEKAEEGARISARGSVAGASAASASGSTRVVLVTDTLGDVNGVSRFIRNVAEQALLTNTALDVVTSTRFACPDQPNVHNLRPRYSRPMPGYPTLDVVWPNAGAIHALLDRLKPTVLHVSTPGPVGSVGRSWALKRGVPLIGTYHTDFPAYIEHLFNDAALTWVCSWSMKRFYQPFARVFSRSDEYAQALIDLGVGRERIDTLLPGIDTDVFNPGFRDGSGAIWRAVNATMPDESERIRAGSVKLLYVGRVSVEKNLPWLVKVWPGVRAGCQERGVDAQLIVVGDGPYLKPMREELTANAAGGASSGAVFLGFRFGRELSTIYASSDVFVFPSTTDTLGQVVMESQAAGLAVIVTDQGGPAGVVDDGKTGHVLAVSPPMAAEAAWTGTMIELSCDEPRRRAMGIAAAAKIAPMSIRHSFAHFWEVHDRVSRARAK
jgi:glycosyltransferase involved in cell wall biosynthesis